MDNNTIMRTADTVAVDYNTQRKPLVLPEYGRCIQNMVEHAKTLADKEERQRCANTIVALMANMTEAHGDAEDFRQKLWNHLAAIANYELDIDYPVEIERLEDTKASHGRIPYPQKRIAKRHYGAIIEALTQKLTEIEDPDKQRALTEMVANQMKRSLGRWNRDAINEDKVLNDIAAYTGGQVSPTTKDVHFLSDGQIMSEVQQMTPSTKKKKKK